MSDIELPGDEPGPNAPKKRTRKLKDSGNGAERQMPTKSEAIEDAKAIAEAEAKTPNIMGGAVKPAGEARKADPYDPDRYTESVDFAKLAGTKQIINQLPVGKPAPDDYIRVHPTLSFANVPLCAPSGEKGQLYLLDSSNEQLVLDMQKHTRNYLLYYYVTAEGKLGLWAIPGPHPNTGKWHESPRTAVQCAERAKTEWVQVHHEEGLGYVAEGPRGHADPNRVPAFADFTRRRLLELGFLPYTIKDHDHPYVRRCLFMSAGKPETK
jgi:hypothetical protein